jgi:hypothetical protein
VLQQQLDKILGQSTAIFSEPRIAVFVTKAYGLSVITKDVVVAGRLSPVQIA